MTSEILNFCVSKKQSDYLKNIDPRAIPDFNIMVDSLQSSRSYINFHHIYDQVIIEVDREGIISVSYIKNANTHNVNITKKGKVYVNGVEIS